MTKYLQNLSELVSYLEQLDFKDLLEWVSKFIIRGYTAPLAFISRIQSRSSFIDQVFDISEDFDFKMKFKDVIRNIYRSYPKDRYRDYTFVELLEIIGRLNVTDLFPELWRDAWGEEFKNIPINDFPKSVDLHTYLLKSLFGISLDEKNIEVVIKLIKRDIPNPKYMLECFEALYLFPKKISTAIKYIPLLLKEMSLGNRDFEGSLCDFINKLGTDNFSIYFPEMLKLIMYDENLIKNFSNVLYLSKIETIGDNPDCYINLKDGKDDCKIKLKSSVLKTFSILYSYLSTTIMLKYCDMGQSEIISDILPATERLDYAGVR